MRIHLPFKNKKFPITQLFGAKFLYRGKIVSHKGVDWAMPKFTPLLAPFSGEIYRVEKTRTYGYGRTVYIRTNDKKLGKVEVLMGHCTDILVNVGYKVQKGDKVAYSGNTGFWRGKNGYHCHFGLKINGIYVDPLKYLNIKDENQKNLFSNTDEALYKAFHGEYKVRQGDNLWRIAEIFYRNGAHYMEIFNVNQDILESPNNIEIGQRLRIPALQDKGI